MTSLRPPVPRQNGSRSNGKMVQGQMVQRQTVDIKCFTDKWFTTKRSEIEVGLMKGILSQLEVELMQRILYYVFIITLLFHRFPLWHSNANVQGHCLHPTSV